MTTYDIPKSRYKHIYTPPYNSQNSPRAEQLAVASSRHRFLREIIREEPNNISNQIFYHTKTYKSLQIRKPTIYRKKYDCCRGWAVYYVGAGTRQIGPVVKKRRYLLLYFLLYFLT